MEDTNYILYTDSKGVRRIEKLSTEERIDVIGFGRYSVLLHSSEGDGDPEPNGTYPIISSDVFNELYGKVLTVVDASFPVGEQKEAFKSLLKETMSNWYEKNTLYTLKTLEQAVQHQDFTDNESE